MPDMYPRGHFCLTFNPDAAAQLREVAPCPRSMSEAVIELIDTAMLSKMVWWTRPDVHGPSKARTESASSFEFGPDRSMKCNVIFDGAAHRSIDEHARENRIAPEQAIKDIMNAHYRKQGNPCAGVINVEQEASL